MLEILLSGGKTGRYFPNSGPGTKVLQAGDKNYGFFGTVTEEEMMVNDEFTRLLNDTNAQVRSIGNLKNIWFKFIVNERVLFIPQKPLAGKIPLGDLYAMRAVFDTDEQYKPVTDPFTGQPLYSQTRHVSNGTDLFKLRLMDAIPTDYKPATNANWSYAQHPGEAWKLLNSLIKNTVGPPDTLGIKTYDLTPFIQLHDGQSYNGHHIKEFFPGATPGATNTFLHLASGGTTVSATLYYESAWRPVLELVPPISQTDMVYLPENLAIQNQDLPSQTITSGEVIVDLMKLTGFTNETDAEQVVLTGTAPAAYRLAPMGGALVTEEGNTAPPILNSTDDVTMSLYDMSSASSTEYGGYGEFSTDSSSSLEYATGALSSDAYGYVVVS
jgi:hypothetical protein